MPKTTIEWCTHSWPVVNGCRRISAGCGKAHEGGCYAERLAATRLKHTERYRGLARMTKNGPQWTGVARLDERELAMPLRLAKPARIFVADMGDLFYEGVTDVDIGAVFGLMHQAGQHTFLVLSKRAERMRQWITGATAERCVAELAWRKLPTESVGGRRDYLRHMPPGWGWPLRNVGVGVSVEDRESLWRIDELRATPAAFRFVSFEPLLEDLGDVDLTGISWAIVGGEAGPRSRPFDLTWARSLIAQCRAQNVRPFFKQAGARPVISTAPSGGPDDGGDLVTLRLRHRKGADLTELPPDLRLREFEEYAHA